MTYGIFPLDDEYWITLKIWKNIITYLCGRVATQVNKLAMRHILTDGRTEGEGHIVSAIDYNQEHIHFMW